MTDASVIFVDDDPHIRQAIAQTLTLEDLSIACFEDARSGLESISQDYEGVVLCDYNMPGMDGLEMLDRIRAMDETIPVIILTGQGDISTAVTAMQQGAYDFIEKPFDHDELLELLRHALEKRHLALENRRLKAQLKHLARPGPRILGDSAGMQKVMATIDPVLDISANILLHGETGSGKDALARYIHENSPRSAHNFVAINCGAVPENLIESELFGYVAGAFTGARARGMRGMIQQADGGTLFLDEVGELPVSIQAKLLRVLESGEIRRLGDSKSIFIDTRIITATNKDLASEVKKGSFREDLFFRINIVYIPLPPLRERKEDIPLLVEHFLQTHKINLSEKKVCSDALESMMKYNWPGNIRELENLIENMMIIVDDEKIGVCNLPEEIRAHVDTNDYKLDADVTLSGLEKQHIINTLSKMNGNKTRVAETLGISIKTLYNNLKSYHLSC